MQPAGLRRSQTFQVQESLRDRQTVLNMRGSVSAVPRRVSARSPTWPAPILLLSPTPTVPAAASPCGHWLVVVSDSPRELLYLPLWLELSQLQLIQTTGL